MRSLRMFLFCCCVSVVGGCDSDAETPTGFKTVDQLNAEEQEALKTLTVSMYQAVTLNFTTRGLQCMTIPTTYESLPLPDGRYGPELKTPFSVVGYACVAPIMHSPEVLTALEGQLRTKIIDWRSLRGGAAQRMRVVQGHFFQSTFGQNDMVTLIPTQISVAPVP